MANFGNSDQVMISVKVDKPTLTTGSVIYCSLLEMELHKNLIKFHFQ